MGRDCCVPASQSDVVAGVASAFSDEYREMSVKVASCRPFALRTRKAIITRDVPPYRIECLTESVVSEDGCPHRCQLNQNRNLLTER